MEQTTKDNYPPDFPHNLVTYVTPLDVIPATMEALLAIEQERALAENAVWYFLQHPSWCDRDRARLDHMYRRRGWNMFLWKYYRIGRAYLGDYRPLSACLKLRGL